MKYVEEVISELQKIRDEEGNVPVVIAAGVSEWQIDSIEYADNSIVIEGED